MPEEPIEEVIGIGRRVRPRELREIMDEYEQLLKRRATLRKRLRRYIMDEEEELTDVTMVDLTKVQLDILIKEDEIDEIAKRYINDSEGTDEGSEEGEHMDGNGSETVEVGESFGFSSEEEEEETEDDEDDIAILLGIDEI